jgi:predicted O-methyltransferase YrrM
MNINEALQLALTHHQSGSFQQAEYIYREILKVQPDHFDALYFLGLIKYQIKDYDSAIIDFEAVLNHNPQHAHAYCYLGNALRENGQPEKAIDYYKKALNLNPSLSEADKNLTLALKEKDQLREEVDKSDWISMIGKKIKLESQVHPHCEEEKAYLYHTFDDGGTEIEALDVLIALIRLFKPTLMLETGTWQADGTVAFGTALKKNGGGKLISLEIVPNLAEKAKEKIRQFGLTQYVEVINQSSLDFIENLDASKFKFDFAFFDSSSAIRPEEFHKLYNKGALTSLISFHDTSRLREKTLIIKGEPQDEYVKQMDEIENKYCRGGIEFSLSRGLRIMQLRQEINPAFINNKKNI